MKLPNIFTTLLSTYFRWVVVTVMVIILALGYWLVISQQLSTIRTTSVAERNRTEQQLKSEQNYLSALKSSIERFHQVLSADRLATVDDFLPSSSDFPGLLLTVRNLAAAANVALRGLSLSQGGQVSATGTSSGSLDASSTAANAAAATSLSIKTQDVTLAVAGGNSYEDFKRLLSVIERSRRLFDVVQLTFGVASGQNVSPAYALVVRTYYLPSGN